MDFFWELIILAGALGTLIFTRLPADSVGMGVIVLLILTGSATPAQALSGFSHPATLMVASVFILSGGVQRTGVSDGLVIWIRRHAGSTEQGFLRTMTGAVAAMSAFLSNTAVVAVFLPMVLQLAREKKHSASRLLMPLSFAAILGGMCTLIGTSTNIVVANLAESHGMEPMGMFDFLPIGLAIALPGLLYLVYFSRYVIPDRRHGSKLETEYPLRKYLTEVELKDDSELIGHTLLESGLSRDFDLDVLEVHRGDTVVEPTPSTILLKGDVLLVHAPLKTIQQIRSSPTLRLRSEGKLDHSYLLGSGMRLVEAVVPPGSPLVGRTLQHYSFRNRFGLTALALYHRREVILARVGKVALRVGDVLLLYGPRTRLKQLADSTEVLTVVQIHPSRPRRRLGPLAVGILAATVIAASFQIIPVMHAMLAGAALMLLTGCIGTREAFRAVDRKTIFLLAGMISLGLSMERTGVAMWFADHVMVIAAQFGPRFLLATTYLVTALLTEVLTNNACAVVMTPVAIATAAALDLDATPFLFAVAYGASASFLSPLGYQTNLFVYGAGGFRFTDFFRSGWPLSLWSLIAVTWLLPLMLPFSK